MLRLSFIVPFYNVEPYIEECIRSLYNQDIPWDDYEVICIDDCSPDGSRAIVERLQQEYSTLKLLRTPENLRQGGARNLGLKHARGKYVWFVDSDDFIEPNVLDFLLSQTENEDIDIIRFYHRTIGTDSWQQNMIAFGPCTGNEFVFDAPLQEKPDHRCCSVCVCILKRTLLLNNKIYFVEKTQFEDDDYAYQFYSSAKSLKLVARIAYVARRRPNSTTTSIPTAQTVHDLVKQTRRILKLKKSLMLSDKRWGQLIHHWVSWTIYGQVIPIMSKFSIKEKLLVFRKNYIDFLAILPSISLKSLLKSIFANAKIQH